MAMAGHSGGQRSYWGSRQKRDGTLETLTGWRRFSRRLHQHRSSCRFFLWEGIFDVMPMSVNDGPRLRILQTLNELSRDLVFRAAADELLPKIMSAVTSLLPVPVASLWRSKAARVPESLVLEAVRDTGGHRSPVRSLALLGSISQHVILSRRCQAVPDLAAGPASPEKTYAVRQGLVAFLCVPVAVDPAVGVGVLHCYTPQRHDFSELEIQTGEALGLLIGSLWQRAEWREEIQHLKDELKNRKRIDRAKEILMARRSMTGEDAYRWIQKRSMDSRRSMREVAETIILSEQSGHYSSIPHALDFPHKPPRE